MTAKKYGKTYSDYEIKNTAIKFNKENDIAATKIGCVGKLEDEMETKTVTKKCEGRVVKSRTKGTGFGTIKISAHINYDVYTRMYGMYFTELAPGVFAYGKDSKHEEFTLMGEVYDEDDVKKLVAYPNCTVSSGKATKIENGAEEVAEVEFEIAVCPDDYGFGKYEAIEEMLEDDNIKSKWMTSFSHDLVKASNVVQTNSDDKAAA